MQYNSFFAPDFVIPTLFETPRLLNMLLDFSFPKILESDAIFDLSGGKYYICSTKWDFIRFSVDKDDIKTFPCFNSEPFGEKLQFRRSFNYYKPLSGEIRLNQFSIYNISVIHRKYHRIFLFQRLS